MQYLFLRGILELENKHSLLLQRGRERGLGGIGTCVDCISIVCSDENFQSDNKEVYRLKSHDHMSVHYFSTFLQVMLVKKPFVSIYKNIRIKISYSNKTELSAFY